MKREPFADDLYRIKDLLAEWAARSIDRQKSYPSQAAFATERVDNSNRSTESYYDDAPEEIVKLNGEVERLAPPFKRILALEYLDRRPQKVKAAVLGIPRQVFSQRLLWIHEQLNFVMFGG
jgi:hypothetical protein